MKKKYFIPGLIVMIILLVTFFIKGIYPFGKNYIIWGDMYEQIVPLYYNFYDIVFNGKSVMIDYTGGIASNLIANFAYYIVSPFTLIVLLFKRASIPNAVSIIVLLKIILSAITCNYFLDKKFEKKNNFYKCFFSVVYALSTYNLSMYIITGWIDIVYLFPLLMLGLDKLLNSKKPTMFIVILTLCLIFNFYISLMCIIFIFFITLIYLKIYNKENIGRIITVLGISVVVSLLMSSIILVPVFIQILSSARMGFNFNQLFSSKLGPIIDKLMFLTSTMASVACSILLLKRYKDGNETRKNIKFIVLSALIVGLSLIIEPINKMWHFGSYVSYPYRYGFILIFILIIASFMYINLNDKNKKEHKLLITLTTIIAITLTIIISYKYYPVLQESVNKLSFSYNHKAFFVAVVLATINLITYLVLFKFGNKDGKLTKMFLLANLIVFSFCQSLIYINIDKTAQKFHDTYINMNYISTLKTEAGYHLKQEDNDIIANPGAIINKPMQDYFTSLTDNNMFIEYQKLGYHSYWMNTSSRESNYFLDFVLSNKYLITKNNPDAELYSLYSSKSNLKIYETSMPISKGYILKENKSLENVNSSFENTNIIYKALSNDTTDIMNIYKDFKLVNATYDGKKLSITDKNKEAYLERDFDIKDKKTLYLEIFTSYMNSDKNKLYSCFDIYVNGKLLKSNFYSKDSNASLNLGTFENETVNVKILIKKDIAKNISIKVGLLDRNLLKKYFNDNKYDVDINYTKDCLNVSYNSKTEDILFIPVPYLNGMRAKLNGNDIEIIKVFDGFIGIRLMKGSNNIKIDYTTPGLKLGILFTCIGIIAFVVFIKFYNEIIRINLLHKISYIIYLILYTVLLLVFYIVPFIMFITSFII